MGNLLGALLRGCGAPDMPHSVRFMAIAGRVSGTNVILLCFLSYFILPIFYIVLAVTPRNRCDNAGISLYY